MKVSQFYLAQIFSEGNCQSICRKSRELEGQHYRTHDVWLSCVAIRMHCSRDKLTLLLQNVSNAALATSFVEASSAYIFLDYQLAMNARNAYTLRRELLDNFLFQPQ